MNPYVSWAIVLVVAGGLGYYYTDSSKSKGRILAKTTPDRTDNRLSSIKPKKRSRKTPEPTSPSSRKAESPQIQPVDVTPDDAVEEGVDNREFAKRFAAARQGVLASETGGSRKPEKRIRTVPASQAESPNNELSTSHLSTGTSSTTGADADDDLSSTGSPVVRASVPNADDISDMLEAPAPGASVLRLTGSMEQPAPKTRNQSIKSVETKKQRQQRQKNETRKEQIQEAEVQRRKLLEKQLHSAREAERREDARQQPSGPASNVWKANRSFQADNQTPITTPRSQTSLLDTFEPHTTSKLSGPTNGAWATNLPSEEEQMRILGVSTTDDDWTTVSTKKGKKKAAKSEDGISSDASAPEAVNGEQQTLPSITVISSISSSGEKGHPLDSDWVA